MGTKCLTSDSPTSQIMSVPINAEQATNLIVERARQLVNQLVEDRGHDKPPFLAEEFAALKGFKVMKEDLGETSAVLFRFHDGYVIKVNQKHNLARQNFSCAHEIGHTLLNEPMLKHYIGNIEYRTYDPQGEREARAAARERLCDAAATELLMPEVVFRKYLSGFGVSVHSIERLASIFRVSIRSTAWRIAEVSSEPCLALMWQPWPRTNSKGLRLAWRVGPGRKKRGRGQYMPLHTLVRYPSILHKAYQYDNPAKCHRLFKLDTTVKRLPMESKGFGRDGTRYVISLAFVDR